MLQGVLKMFKKNNFRNKRIAKLKGISLPKGVRFLPQHGDYSLKSILNPFVEVKPQQAPLMPRNKKRPKKSLWSRKKEKTGRRLLLQKHRCIITYADKKTDSSDTGD